MNATINFSEVSFDYPVCLNRECTQADTCLRQLIEPTVPANTERLTIINPKYLASQEGACPSYRPAVKIRFAKGFVRMLENLPHKQMQIVISRLMNYFNRRTYYRVRNGERLLSPTEQQWVLNVLKNCGVTNPGDFDAYVEKFNW